MLEFFLWLTNMCHPQTLCVQSDSIACNRCRHLKCTSVTEGKHVNTAHAYSLHCVHTWPAKKKKVDYTILSKPILRQKSHYEPHFSTNSWDNLTLQHAEGEVWVWQATTVISSCHYLPSHSQLCSQRQMHEHCMQANMHRRTQKHTRVHHMQKTNRTQLKVMPVPCFSLWLIVSLLDECCQLSWQK